ncbi:unnamed protein product [Moneuplotes crassus]|uniref:Uncharacterized protein n=1 Tax=Euplotes crassus TaxID=5936 RepID=A0AAD1XIR8_EUPCR|nr:unnamed protein product [Moneuplotes crassus]
MRNKMNENVIKALKENSKHTEFEKEMMKFQLDAYETLRCSKFEKFAPHVNETFVSKLLYSSPEPVKEKEKIFQKRSRSLHGSRSRSPSQLRQSISCMRLSQGKLCSKPGCPGNHRDSHRCHNGKNIRNLQTSRSPKKNLGCGVQTNIQMRDLENFDLSEIKVFKTYEKMLENTSKLICKHCSVKLRPEKFYEHILLGNCQNHISKHSRKRSEVIKGNEIQYKNKEVVGTCGNWNSLNRPDKGSRKDSSLISQKTCKSNALIQIDQNSCTELGSSKDELLRYLSLNNPK